MSWFKPKETREVDVPKGPRHEAQVPERNNPKEMCKLDSSERQKHQDFCKSLDPKNYSKESDPKEKLPGSKKQGDGNASSEGSPNIGQRVRAKGVERDD